MVTTGLSERFTVSPAMNTWTWDTWTAGASVRKTINVPCPLGLIGEQSPSPQAPATLANTACAAYCPVGPRA